MQNAAETHAHPILIGDKTYPISGDKMYMDLMGDIFEPRTVNMLHAFCQDGTHALDVGANIGLTALALSQVCERVVGIEPVSRTFDYLQANISGENNIAVFKYALGKEDGVVAMQSHVNFLAGAAISDSYTIPDSTHFTEHEIKLKTLDNEFHTMGLSRLDFMKVDVEGFELDVFDGGRQVVGDFKPTAFLEMNHWCLNVYRRISIPEFRERLLTIFPFVYAIDGANYVDYGDSDKAHEINHGHVVQHRYNNLVAGFDRDYIIGRLEDVRVNPTFVPAPQTPSALDAALSEIADLRRRIASDAETIALFRQNYEIMNYTSWRVIAPLRALLRHIRW